MNTIPPNVIYIKPISVWYEGQTISCSIFDLTLQSDNLYNAANLFYRIGDGKTYPVSGNLIINGQDYQDWDADPSANDWIINWSLSKLNLEKM
jgi:hypothetical protein